MVTGRLAGKAAFWDTEVRLSRASDRGGNPARPHSSRGGRATPTVVAGRAVRRRVGAGSSVVGWPVVWWAVVWWAVVVVLLRVAHRTDESRELARSTHERDLIQQPSAGRLPTCRAGRAPARKR